MTTGLSNDIITVGGCLERLSLPEADGRGVEGKVGGKVEGYFGWDPGVEYWVEYWVAEFASSRMAASKRLSRRRRDASHEQASAGENVVGRDAGVENAFAADDAVVEDDAAAGHGVADRRNLRNLAQCIPRLVYDAVAAMASPSTGRNVL
ncbi:hypothetical protein CGMCC3_g16391 [Colletotrichum fructicola]|nr:uncharacterized protein CGMCC3_g16391 [Colletotrichum fructicola]KAE9567439.1 hypothetical protein CGMCC3_g16391 [Colletotrichum fructicola]